ncbi:MAG TPA: FAD-dependent oxidoreductase [Candidatus Tumulicola sp.]|nr:FAD-dependent oxidoreductase [Candidatus Tumulicola sp.]
MGKTHEFDFCVLGAGSAGYAAAVIARDLGKSVALADGTGPLAGLCILRGCMPSKTLLRSAEVAHLAAKAAEVGVIVRDVRPDMTAIIERKRRIIQGFAEYRVEGIEKFPLFRGAPRFTGARELKVGEDVLRAQKFLIATGSIVDVPDIAGLKETGFLTSDDVLELERLPKSIIVLGGGPVACELAQYLARCGSDVTMVQRSVTLLSDEDEDVGEALETALEKEGIAVVTGTKLASVDRKDGKKRVVFEGAGHLEERSADEILLALGRRAKVEGFDFEAAGVVYDRDGIKVDGYLRTSNPDVYAAGDCNGLNQLVHVAVYEGQLAARNAFGETARAAEYDLQYARAVFTDPQVAIAGCTERECRNLGIAYSKAVYPFSDLGKGIATNLTEGFVKMLAARDGRILGVAIVGAEASDMIHEAIALLYFKANVRDVLEMPHLHPTLAEIITYPAEELNERLERETHVLVRP